MSEYIRLTARNQRNLAYLVNVKQDEQAVESTYPNTLRCIMDSFQRLAEYEDSGLSPSEVSEIVKAIAEYRLEEVVRCKDCEFHDDCICVVCEDGKTVVCNKRHMHVQKDDYCSHGKREAASKQIGGS